MSGSSFSTSNRSLIDSFDFRPLKDWSWVKRFFSMRSPFSLIDHCSVMFNGAQAPHIMFEAVLMLMGKAKPCVTSFSTSLCNIVGWLFAPLWLPRFRTNKTSSLSVMRLEGRRGMMEPCVNKSSVLFRGDGGGGCLLDQMLV